MVENEYLRAIKISIDAITNLNELKHKVYSACMHNTLL